MENKTNEDKFIIIHDWMLTELKLKNHQAMIYAIIYGFIKTGTAFTGSAEYLAQRTGLSRRTVQRTLRELEAMGLVDKSSERGRRLSTFARTANRLPAAAAEGNAADSAEEGMTKQADVCQQLSQEGATKQVGKSPDLSQGGATKQVDKSPDLSQGGATKQVDKSPDLSPNNKDNKENKKEDRKDTVSGAVGTADATAGASPAGVSVRSNKTDFGKEFESIWELYPSVRKQGKAQALSAYRRARRRGTTQETVRNALKAYIAQIECENTEPRYIKQGGAWFSEQRWLDEYNTMPTRRGNRAAGGYLQHSYTAGQLEEMGIDFGEDVYES